LFQKRKEENGKYSKPVLVFVNIREHFTALVFIRNMRMYTRPTLNMYCTY